jgi:hypothetical protein
MTWTKTGDEFADECWQLSDAAYRLHHEGLTWSNRKHLDGRLDKNEMVRWAKNPGAAEELLDIGFWSDEGDHFQIHHAMGWQPTAEQWFHQSEVNRANRAKGKTRPVRETNRQTNRQTKGTGRDGPGERNRGTSLGDGQSVESAAEGLSLAKPGPGVDGDRSQEYLETWGDS